MDAPRVAAPRSLYRAALRTAIVVLATIAVVSAAWFTYLRFRDRAQTDRTTARFEPPVWAGQNVPGACSGGFYARGATGIVLTIVAHCAEPGTTLKTGAGEVIGTFGPRAELTDCPTDRFCAPSDFLALELEDRWIPWGHLNMVDLGAGGYRTFAPDTRALACGDIHVGERVEVDGREHYRTGTVTAVAPYQFASDTMFPCMAVADIETVVGDSGGAVLVDGQPAGIVSRALGGRMGFTPLAEGLENLGLELCTTPNCD
ncbi:MAG TPA: hypothetical protein VFI18_01550 [Gaiellales bacterium]|nr:hypothetical protein [Gaiellales bacterium]